MSFLVIIARIRVDIENPYLQTVAIIKGITHFKDEITEAHVRGWWTILQIKPRKSKMTNLSSLFPKLHTLSG